MNAVSTFRHRNHLLANLPPADALRWGLISNMVPLEKNQVLFDSGKSVEFIYFPVACVVSIQYQFEDGDTVGYSHVGNEGLVGLHAFMGARRCSSMAVVMSSGLAYRVPLLWMEQEFNTSVTFRCLLMSYLQTWLLNTSQNVVCNRKHSVEQQLARTLLSMHDKISGNILSLTHEALANMLGVRREGVSVAANHMQRLGCIAYSRGQLTVLNRPGIEAIACECYAVVRQQYVRLFAETNTLSLQPGCFYSESSH